MFNKTFIDPQGTQQTDAIVCITSANIRLESTSGYSLDLVSGSSNTDETRENMHLDFSAVYYKNQASKDAGDSPYPLMNEHFQHRFSKLVDPDVYRNMTALEAAEYCCNQIIDDIQ